MKNSFLPMILLAVLISTQNSFAQEDTLALTGFKVENDSAVSMTLSFQDQERIAISKARFKSEPEADSFCQSIQGKLDKNFRSLTLAMSGAALANETILQAISIKIANKTGIGQWGAVGRSSVIFMLDGHGTDLFELTQGQLLERGIHLDLPAICVLM